MEIWRCSHLVLHFTVGSKRTIDKKTKFFYRNCQDRSADWADLADLRGFLTPNIDKSVKNLPNPLNPRSYFRRERAYVDSYFLSINLCDLF